MFLTLSCVIERLIEQFVCFKAWAYYVHAFVDILPLLRRCVTISFKETAINEEIKCKEVRLLDKDGNQMGIVPTAKALEMAYEQDLDLVTVSTTSEPYVCRMMNYGKFRFEKEKREKDSKKKQKVINVKELRFFGTNIDKHDIETKSKHINRFLKAGNKVKITIKFRGREYTHPEKGVELTEKILSECDDCYTIEKAAKLEGRNMIMFLAPKPNK